MEFWPPPLSTSINGNEAPAFAFLMGSQVLPVPLVWEPILGTPVVEVKHTLKTKLVQDPTPPPTL